MEVKVSIVIPVYNVELYLRECLDSVVNQTLREIEIICVNDASTDNSLEILASYAKSDSRIRLFSYDRNRGVSYARNLGMKFAKGKYLVFLDSDDKLTYDSMQRCFELAELKKVEILTYDFKVFYESQELKNERADLEKVYTKDKVYVGVRTGEKLLAEMIQDNNYSANVTLCFFNKEYLDGLNLHFVEDIFFEDVPFSFEAFIKSKRVLHMPEGFYLRRIRRNSIVTMKKRFIHAYRAWVNYMLMINLIENMPLDVYSKGVFCGFISKRLEVCRRFYKNLEETEAQKYKDLADNERCLFESLVVKFVDLEKIVKVIVDRNRRLVTKNEKLEIENGETLKGNSILRDAVVGLEKNVKLLENKNSELLDENVSLRDAVVGLEKNVKLLENKNSELLDKNITLNKQIKLTIKKLNMLRNDYFAIKTGYSFKIGRVMTYIPRKIKDFLGNNKK